MPGTQELTRRIKSVKSTRKITRAMQLVSAAKMRKAQEATKASRAYTQASSELMNSLGTFKAGFHPLLANYAKAKKVGVLLISSNRGLVGSFNSNLTNQLKKYLELNNQNETELVVMGKKIAEGSKRTGKKIIAEFTKIDTTIPPEDIYPLAKLITQQYQTGQFKEIVIIYNHFVSTLIQEPRITRLLPFSLDGGQNKDSSPSDYEPDPHTVLNHLIPRIIESQLYQAVLESDASEHSARMVMMKNATEAAGDLVDDLTLTFNKLRQNKITTELSEITAGRISLEQK